MIALKVEKIGDRIAVVLTEEALAALNLGVGDVIHVEPARDGVIREVTRETWIEDPHARGRAFLRRYNKTFERFEG
jgi:antitoxin component of MazEF toxin-antitoxin module